ncbi:MAG: isocitrate lyase/phosphoenolpyruvate mutase family protein [Rhodobacteraceae bacterium]|nr:isocitrate lyase/phosphoenolpyruvate mutase family protein [Alphaproteobacteria bacterium]NNK65702.1 isocitrate lyase/phosphoenolpyruvate mutase family protein [Paracoccaceae bacterium]
MTHDPGSVFRALHVPGDPFILVNVWDAGTARMAAAMGAKALATSSAAHAFTLGRPDGGTLTRDEALTHAQDIVAATDLPVNGDFENGFGDDPDTCAETVRLAAEAGLAGIGIEDTMFPSGAPYPADLAAERIRAAAAAARALPRDFVLTARADGILTGTYGIDEAITRLQATEAAGADCLYAPMPKSPEDLRRIVAETGKPVNALAAGPYTKLEDQTFAALGVARISLGSALARAAHKTVHDALADMLGTGLFDRLGHVLPGADADKLIS